MPTGKDYLSSRADGEGETVSAIVVSQQQRRGAGKDQGRIEEVGCGAGAGGRRRSGWSRSWVESQRSGRIAQLGAGGSLRIEDQLAWWSRSGGQRNRRVAG